MDATKKGVKMSDPNKKVIYLDDAIDALGHKKYKNVAEGRRLISERADNEYL